MCFQLRRLKYSERLVWEGFGGKGSLKFHLLCSDLTSVSNASPWMSFPGGDGREFLSFSTYSCFKMTCSFEKKPLDICGPNSLYL